MQYLIMVLVVLFAPILILLLRSILSLVFNWVFPGPSAVNAVLRSKKAIHDWKIGQRSITALFGRAELDFDMEQLDQGRKKLTAMLEARAIFGKVKIKCPAEMELIIDYRGVLSKFTNPGHQKFIILRSMVDDFKEQKHDERNLKMIISARSILGSFEVERKNN